MLTYPPLLPEDWVAVYSYANDLPGVRASEWLALPSIAPSTPRRSTMRSDPCSSSYIFG